jgi:Sulfatase
MKIARRAFLAFLIGSAVPQVSTSESLRAEQRTESSQRNLQESPPNVIIFIVDDLGWNQVGYHAAPAGNNEIKTPHIDYHAATGIEMDRGSMTPWCGPSRAAIMTGRTNVYNANVSSLISAYDDSIGFVAGLPPGTKTIATAFKAYGESIGKPYKAYANGKWGIGVSHVRVRRSMSSCLLRTHRYLLFRERRIRIRRSEWDSTNIGATGVLGWTIVVRLSGEGLRTSLDGGRLTFCYAALLFLLDGLVPPFGIVATYFPKPLDNAFGPKLVNALPGYWEQHPDFADTDWCPYITNLSDDILTPEEKFIACKTRPRKLPKLLDLDLLDNVVDQIKTHDYSEGPILQYFATAMLHQPITYPKEYDVNASASLPEYFQPNKTKPTPGNNDFRLSINNAVRYMDDLFGSTMQAVKDAGQWNNTIVYFTTDNGGPIYTAAGKHCIRYDLIRVLNNSIRLTVCQRNHATMHSQ